jgi:hypothetical protein
MLDIVVATPKGQVSNIGFYFYLFMVNYRKIFGPTRIQIWKIGHQPMLYLHMTRGSYLAFGGPLAF